MTNWQQLVRNSVTTIEELEEHFPGYGRQIPGVIETYPMRINPYYLSLIKEPGDPFWRQAVPDGRELSDPQGLPDPLAEERDSPVPNLTHRYPDRVLFLISPECAMYCRFCTRKRKVGRSLVITDSLIQEGIAYIRDNKNIRDVLLSGGDPLLLDDDRLEAIIRKVREIPHVEIIRVGTRVPCTLPQRITPALVERLKPYQPLFFNLHFNHPRELTPQAAQALALLADGGFPLGNQSVLLRGINDHKETLKALFTGLLQYRVRPYYLYLADLAQGTGHFRTDVKTGLEIMSSLQGRVSGLALPHFVVDTPGGGGKVPLLENNLVCSGSDYFQVTNYQGRIFTIPQPPPQEFPGENGNSYKDQTKEEV
ncbi:MAG: KamA family radical SAM protein [Limnochordia bacterium]